VRIFGTRSVKLCHAPISEDPDLLLTAIAYHLGYSELSAFSRAQAVGRAWAPTMPGN